MRNLFDDFYMSGRITGAQKRPLHNGHKRAKNFMKSHLFDNYLSKWWFEFEFEFEFEFDLTWVDCFHIDSGGFILFSEINQILLKIYLIPMILTFYVLIYYVSNRTLSGNWVSSQTQTQVIVVTDNCSPHF